MLILAFKDRHEPSACLLGDGRLIAACEEERFTRVKHAPGQFPWNALEFCLTEAGVSLREIDHIVYASLSWRDFLPAALLSLVRDPPRRPQDWRYSWHYCWKGLRRALRHYAGQAPYQRLFRHFGSPPRFAHKIDHHLAHAASVYYYLASAEQSCTILTLDGKGDAASGLCATAGWGRISELRRFGLWSSTGLVYAAFTDHLGFKVNDGEFKVMGLAPYGTPRFDLSNVLSVSANGRPLTDSRFLFHSANDLASLGEIGVARRSPGSRLTREHADLAASVQHQLEQTVVALAKKLLAETGHRTLCLAGGVAQNVKLVLGLREAGVCEEVLTHSAVGDAGLVLGAAAHYYHRFTGQFPEPLRNLRLGPSYSDRILRDIAIGDGRFRRLPNLTQEIATLLAAGKIVGWFQGRMEFGPRALGGRSILADPRSPLSRIRLNRDIKLREEFRPFCPAMLREDYEAILVSPSDNLFMSAAFRVRPEWRHALPAVTHVDGTTRPQLVLPDLDPLFYDLLSEFKRITGIGVLLNTSLNRRGEPIVATPSQALDLFRDTELDALVLGDYLALRG